MSQGHRGLGRPGWHTPRCSRCTAPAASPSLGTSPPEIQGFTKLRWGHAPVFLSREDPKSPGISSPHSPGRLPLWAPHGGCQSRCLRTSSMEPFGMLVPEACAFGLAVRRLWHLGAISFLRCGCSQRVCPSDRQPPSPHPSTGSPPPPPTGSPYPPPTGSPLPLQIGSPPLQTGSPRPPPDREPPPALPPQQDTPPAPSPTGHPPLPCVALEIFAIVLLI